MKFWEAMKALEEGKKVRNINWDKEGFIYLDEYSVCDENNFDVDDSVIDGYFVTSEWEIYKEPVKTYTFLEMIEQVKFGKSAYRKDWLVTRRAISKDVGDFSIEDTEAKDWIVVE